VECIYDSDVRDAKLRNLQSINESLEAELEAAKTLLIQVASGPDRIRSIVLELLQNAKEPLEILEVLSDAGGIDVTMEDSQVPGETTIPPLSTEGVLHHAESFAVSNSGLAENGFEYSSMTQATFYQSHPDTTTNIPVYPIVRHIPTVMIWSLSSTNGVPLVTSKGRLARSPTTTKSPVSGSGNNTNAQ
jgi:hypothetical protein